VTPQCWSVGSCGIPQRLGTNPAGFRKEK